MKNYLKVDDRNKRLIMDRTFDKNRRIVGSPEYDMLQRARADYPHYSVELRRIKKNPEKETYKHLNYAYMREYIRRHPQAELRMAEFEEKCLRAGKNDNPFHRVRDWFFAAYPEIDDFTPADFKKEQEEQVGLDYCPCEKIASGF
jgi:hypothetical protein